MYSKVPAMGKPSASLWFESVLLPSGWAEHVRITVSDGRIARIETAVAAAPDDERHSIALPGVPNVHSHAFQRAMAGLTESRGASGSDTFWSWRELMYRFVAQLTPQQLEAVTAQACIEMLEAGFTRVGEFHYLHRAPDGSPYADRAEMAARIAAAAAETGIGLTLLPVFYAHAGFGGTPALPAQRRFVNTVDEFETLFVASRAAVRTLDGAVVGLAPHSLRAVTPDELEAIVRIAPDVPVHMHVAEQEREVADCLAWSGERPVAWLLGHADIGARWCFVHATHMVADEITGLARAGAVVGVCPITEANLGDGVFPAAEWLGADGAFGIGSDSNVRIDAAEELRSLEYGQRLTRRARNVLAEGTRSTGRHLFERAVAGGARALGVPGPGLSEGAPADLVALRGAHPALAGRRGDAVIDAWVFSAGREAVDCVWRAGRKLVSDGRHAHRDRIAARYAQTVAELLR